MKHLPTSLSCLLLCVSCHSPAPYIRPVDPAVGAGCADACAHAEALTCAGLLTPDGGDCDEVCYSYERNGGYFCTREIASAVDCAAITRIATNGCEG